VGVAPTNASFQAFVTAMRLSLGDERTRGWLEALRCERREDLREEPPDRRGGRGGRGRRRTRQPLLPRARQGGAAHDAPVANHLFEAGDPARSSASRGPASSRATDQRDDAEAFVEFLLSEDAQRFYVDQAEENEYPLVAGIDPPAGSSPSTRSRGRTSS
jgi:iron(III) transport system substrate-binding protein